MRQSFLPLFQSLLQPVYPKSTKKEYKRLVCRNKNKGRTRVIFRILLGERANIFYPTEHMLRVSDGDWRAETTLDLVSSCVW